MKNFFLITVFLIIFSTAMEKDITITIDNISTVFARYHVDEMSVPHRLNPANGTIFPQHYLILPCPIQNRKNIHIDIANHDLKSDIYNGENGHYEIEMVPNYKDKSYILTMVEKTLADGRPRINGMIITSLKQIITNTLLKPNQNLTITIDENQKIILSGNEAK